MIYPLRLNWISQSSYCSSFIRLGESPFLCRTLVSQYSSISRPFMVSNDKLLGLFLVLTSKSVISLTGNCIPKSEDVSCWDCNANSTAPHVRTWGLLEANLLLNRVARLSFLTPNLKNLAFFKDTWRQKKLFGFSYFVFNIWLFSRQLAHTITLVFWLLKCLAEQCY